MTVMTDFRAAVKARLTTIFPDVNWVDGKLEGGPNVTRQELGCVFPDSELESEDTTYLNLGVVVRMFKRTADVAARGTEPTQPRDPAPLEAWAETLRTSLDDIQVGAGGTWYFRVSGIEYDMDQYAFEAAIFGRGENPFQTL